MANKRIAQKVATRTKVLAVAAAMFRERGYEATTIRDVAAKAGMSTGAVFSNWPGKDALYKDVFGHDPINPELGQELAQALAFAAGLLRANQPWSASCDDVIGKALAKARAAPAPAIDEREAA